MRVWHELVAEVGEWVPGGVPALGLILLMITAVGSLLWYWFPEWAIGLGRGLRRLGQGLRRVARVVRHPRRSRRRGGARVAEEGTAQPEPDEPEDEEVALADPEELPEVPAVELALSADELAAQGRYREAVRERLRAIVRDLVERGVVTADPGWTVTELARAAGGKLPEAAPPLAGASEIFSLIWYGQREATAAHDAAMREHSSRVREALAAPRVPS